MKPQAETRIAARGDLFAKRVLVAICVVGCVGVVTLAIGASGGTPQGGPLVVHEWGTFTALQDENGDAISGINVDDEPAPAFVHNVAPALLVKPHAAAERMRWAFGKGIPARYASVTMRLETPVLYFHPAPHAKPFDASVQVSMRGGWLTEFYPEAKFSSPGFYGSLDQINPVYGKITSETVSTLAWPQVTVGGDAAGPATEDRVWTTPRLPEAAALSVPIKEGQEHEKFLFYRGVGHLDMPLRVVTDEKADTLSISADKSALPKADKTEQMAGLWLVSVKPGGELAYRKAATQPYSSESREIVSNLSRAFTGDDYSTTARDALRAEMLDTLVAQGLFADEAAAMLDTWQRAYFQNAGLRVFFIAPRAWTDAVLPLTISPVAQVERVMIGRVELISPEQRSLLKTLSSLAISDEKSARGMRSVLSRLTPGELQEDEKANVPKEYQTYLALGRFRDALVMMEAKRRPTPQLAEFVKNYGVKEFRKDD